MRRTGTHMELSEYRYYSVIGKIQNCAASAETFHDAVCGGIKIMLENSIADHAVLWYRSEKAGLSPYYWIFPADLTARTDAVFTWLTAFARFSALTVSP